MAFTLKYVHIALFILFILSTQCFSDTAEQSLEVERLSKYSTCHCTKDGEKVNLGCVDEEKGGFTADLFCKQIQQPSISLKNCNDKQACLSKWQTTEWKNCSRTCGSGTRTRSLACSLRGESKIVDNSKCELLERPSDNEICNEIDCQAYTVPLGWSRCSRVCGDGVRYQKIDCLKRLGNGSIVASNDCKSIDEIANFTRPCYNQPCEFDNSNLIRVVSAVGNRRRRKRGIVLPVIRTGSGNHWQTKRGETVNAVIGEKVSAVEGTKVTLKCVYGGKPEPRATWFYNGKRIDNDRRLPYDYSYKDYKTILTIPALTDLLAGRYECHIENKNGRLSALSIVRTIRPGEATIFSQKSVINYGPDVKTALITIGTNVTLYDNTELKILCPVQAYPYRYRVRWNIQGAKSTKGITRYGLYGTDLIIRKTKAEQSGRYTCRGQTLWGSDTESSFIIIKGKVPPKITTSQRNVIGRFNTKPFVNVTIGDSLLAEVGARVEVVCPSQGVPKPKITWQRRGVPIQLPNMDMFVKKDSKILVIYAIKSDSADSYSCVATNMAGQDSSTTKISVLPKDASAPVVLSKHGAVTVSGDKKSKSATVGQSIKVFEGKSLALYCPVKSLPKSEITWKFNGAKVEDSNNANFMVDKSGGALLIFGINKKIEGTFSCIAENPLGKSSSSSTLEILSSSYPSVLSRSHDIRIGKDNTQVSIVIGDRLTTSGGRKIIIICSVEGWPRPKVVWNKNGKAITTVSIKKMNSGVANGEILTLNNAVEADSGIYTCYAMNPAGIAMSSSVVKVIATGSPVITSKPGVKKFTKEDKDNAVSIGTNVTAAIGTSITITCPFEGGSQSQVTWMVDKEPINFSKRITVKSHNSLRIENLKFYDSGLYTCKVWNAEGQSSQDTLLTIYGAHSSILKISNKKTKVESYNPDEDLHVIIGHDVTVTQKHNLRITCPVRGAFRPQIKWLRNNSPIEVNSRVFIEGEQLLLSDLRTEDSGSYSCVAITRFGSSNSTTQLTVIAPTKPVIIRNNRDIKVADISSTTKIDIGDRLFAVNDMTVEIQCPVKDDAVPKPKIHWRHNNDVIISNGVFYQVKENNDLLIPKLDASLQGSYTCVAENVNGKDEASTTVLIMLSTAPMIEKSSKHVTQHAQGNDHLTIIGIGDQLKTSAGHDVMIDCEADGIPKPRVLWTKDEIEILNDKNAVVYGNGSLKIVNAQKGDSGKYVCMMINGRGVDKYSSTLKIVDKDSSMIMLGNPNATTHFDADMASMRVQIGSNVTTLDGKTLNLFCPSVGNPKPTITWYKNGIEVTENSRIGFEKNGELLVLKNIQVADAARYTCFADNGRGKDKVTSVVDVVVPLDRLIPEPEEIEVTDLRSNHVSKKVELEVGMSGILLSGKSVAIKCPTAGSIKAKLTWLLGDDVIQSDHKHTIKDGLLIVNGLSSGEYQYTCKAESMFGVKEETSVLSVLDPIQPAIRLTTNNQLSTDEKVRVDIGGNIKVKKGSQLDIKCPYTGVPVPDISWFRNGVELTEKDNVIIKATGSVLRIPYVTMQGAGTYMCSASNGIGKKAKQSIVVEVYKPSSAAINIDVSKELLREFIPKPTMITGEDKVGNIGQNYSILTGMKLVLKCPVAGDPKPDIIWLKNGVEVARNVESLEFENANDVDGGEYACKAENVFGTQVMKSKVKILKQEKPVISRNPKKTAKTEVISSVSGEGFVAIDIGDDLKTLTGTEVAIRCPAIGMPKPRVFFVKDGKIIASDNETFVVDAENGILTIKTTSKQTKGGYLCVAENPAGSFNLTTNIELLDPVPPSIIENTDRPKYGYDIMQGKGYLHGTVGLVNISAYPGTEVFIDCPVSGFPVPDVFWSRNGQRIMEGDGFAVVEKNGTLSLPHLTNAMEGVYECFAVNVAGGYSRNLTVTVTKPSSPIIYKDAGMVDLSQTLKANVTIGKNVVVIVGAEVVIQCPLKAEPAATVIWSGEQGYELEQRDVTEVENGRALKIPKVTKVSSGVYKCIASNIFGSDYAVTRITVAESLKPVITSVKENVTSYMENNEVSVVIGGRLDAPLKTIVTISCPVSGTPSPKVSWLFNGNLLTEEKLVADSATASYTLERLRLKNSGKYTCRAENVLGMDEASTYVNVGMVPKIQSSFNDNKVISAIKKTSVTVIIGSKAKVSTSSEMVLQCFARGIPAPHISWYKNGLLLESDSPYLSVIKGLLDIPAVTTADDGIFTCIARNKFGVDKVESQIIVVDPPKILGEDTNQTDVDESSKTVHASVGGSLTVLRGSQLVVRCPVRGKPTPKIRWRRADAFFNIDPRMTLSPEGDLQIKDIQTDDAGTYVCTAVNEAGSDERSLKLVVAEAPIAQVTSSKFDSMQRAKAPAIGVIQRIVVSKNRNITITCSVQGNPLPKINWFKEGQSIRVDGRKYHTEGDELSIINVNKNDAGSYRCIAENLAGRNMATIKLIVGEKPKIRQSNERIVQTLPATLKAEMGQSIGVRRTSVVMVICDVSGTPKPVITWTKNGGKIDFSLLSESKSVLLLKDVSSKDSGNYTCTAKNAIGHEEASTEVIVLEPPVIVNPSLSDISESESDIDAVLQADKPTALHAIEGEEIKVACVVEGFPLPSVEWHKNMHPLLEETGQTYWTNRHTYINNGKKYIARIVSVLTLKNTGISEFEVSCKGHNEAGKSSAKLALHMHNTPTYPYSGVWISTGADECKGSCIGAFRALNIIENKCLSYGNKIVSVDRCDPSKRPAGKRECRTKRCGTSWGIGPWGECSSKCGNDGLRKRTVKCMFKSGGEVAKEKDCGHMLPRKPRKYELCNRKPCQKDACMDYHSYCTMVKSLGYCRTKWSKQQCCLSCKEEPNRRIAI